MSIDIAVGGMTCNGCVTSLKNVLRREGLESVTVDLGVARVPHGHAPDVDRVKQAIEKAGFTVGAISDPT